MTLIQYCGYIISRAKLKPVVSMSSLNAEAIAECIIEADEIIERASLIAEGSRQTFFVERCAQWKKKWSSPGSDL